VESLMARMDLVVTTRLHGLVLAVKNGVPAIAIDPIAGGAKLLRQANVLKWPICFTADDVDDDRLASAFEYGLTETFRVKARECAALARTRLTGVRERFLEAIASPVRVG
jgi:polysaccharide pyruvyl transferase WcaK-like protein